MVTTSSSDIFSAFMKRRRIKYSGKFCPDFLPKGQLISKANYQAVNSSVLPKNERMNSFLLNSMRCVFVPFLEEVEGSKKGISKLSDL
jgi:hypothetical protein